LFINGEIGSLTREEAAKFIRSIIALVQRRRSHREQVRIHFKSLPNLDLFIESILSPLQNKFEEIDFQLFANLR
jgi:hypothetical protein